MTAKIFSPQRTPSAQRKIFVFFVPFVVQFGLWPMPRYGLMMKKIFFCLISVLILSPQLLAQKYVAVNGSDSNSGTLGQPFKTITKAIAVAVPGDTIFVRGGIHPQTGTINIASNQNGTQSLRYHLVAYRAERPLLDFSSTPLGRKGINLSASYWHLKGLDVKGAGDNGLEINGGSFNIIENCAFFENRDSGVQLSNGAANNRLLNCDSYFNADPPDYADADGFAPKLTVGSGNYFYGCRAWGNCDDGWDGYKRGANNVTTTLENCWTWKNGYLKNGSDPGPQANGNGFKMGGGDNGNSDQLMHHFVLKNCLAFSNKAKGFDQNNNVGSMTLLNCTGYNNKETNYRLTRALNAGQILTVKNSISFAGAVELGAFAIQEKNGWMSPFAVTAADFLSLADSVAASPRQADGSLPNIDFLHLARNSDLIDAGVEVGLPFNGKAPDLGAFESDFATAVEREKFMVPANFQLAQNYPNPFSPLGRGTFGNPATTIKFATPRNSLVRIGLYNVLGEEVMKLVDEEKPAGQYQLTVHAQNLPGGIYFYTLRAGNFSQTKKMLLVR